MPLNTFTIFSLSILHTTILSIHGFLAIRPLSLSPIHTALSMERHGDKLQWDIYVDQSKAAIARGSTATLDAFQTLSPSSSVQVHPCILNSGNRVKSPTVRCRSRVNPEYCLEIANVDSVEKVYRILSRHLQVQDVSVNACYCIKWKHKGNAHLEKEETDLAIQAYDNALATNYAEHEGILLMMRASAYLQRAAKLKLELKNLVLEHTKQVPDTNNLLALYAEAGQVTTLAPSIFQRIESYTRMQETTFRGIKYCHGLYQYAVLHAVQDALRATQLEPQSQQSWLLAADGLGELWKLSDSIQYYKMAAELDPNLERKVQFEISRLENRIDLLENANAYGWSEDILRLALDVGQVD